MYSKRPFTPGTTAHHHHVGTPHRPSRPIVELYVQVRTWDDPSIQENLLTDGIMHLPPTKEEDEAAGGGATTTGIALISVGAGIPLLCGVCAFFAKKGR